MSKERYNQIIDDVYANYENSYAAWVGNSSWSNNGEPWDKENFIRLVETDDRFSKMWGLNIEELKKLKTSI